MAVELDHFIVPARDKAKAGRLLADLLGVACGPAPLGPFFAVYVNEGLTLDFVDSDQTLTIHHYCFRVSTEDFDRILGRIRAAGIAYRSNVHEPVDLKVNTDYGGSMVYWNEPDGHQWEILTHSYARQQA